MNSNALIRQKFKLKNWVIAILLASLSHAVLVDAAGLGRINVLSRLGQPFNAEIELINVSKDELPTLKVSLAPPSAYQAANLPFDPALNALRLSVERRANGAPYIRAATVQRVTEPYLHLVVDLASQETKFQRAYAALLDLPDSAAPVAPAPAPVTAAPAPNEGGTLPRASRTSRAREQLVARDAPAVAAPAPVTPPPAPVVPAVRAPATPAAPPNNGPAPLQAKSEPAKSEPPKPAPATSAPVATDANTTEPPKAESTEPVGAPVAQPQAPLPKKDAVQASPPMPMQRSFVDTLARYWMPIGGAALALLAGLGGLWALRRRKQASEEISGFAAPKAGAESIMRSTSVPAAAVTSAAFARALADKEAMPDVAVQPEDTVASVTHSVDPIKEAQVYRQYGQDDAAEKVLRETLSKQPGREDVQMLLLEILAARSDTEGFNQLAARLHKQTGGLGGHWKRAMAMGFALDPNYPLYSPTDNTATRVARSPAAPAAGMDPGSQAQEPDALGDTISINVQRGGLDGDMEKTMILPKAGVEPAPAAATSLPVVQFELPDSLPAPRGSPDQSAAAPAGRDVPPLDFDIDAFAAKTDRPEEPATRRPAVPVGNTVFEEVQQKLELARAYRAMGDAAGATELLREVEREGDAAQQADAREMLQAME